MRNASTYLITHMPQAYIYNYFYHSPIFIDIIYPQDEASYWSSFKIVDENQEQEQEHGHETPYLQMKCSAP